MMPPGLAWTYCDSPVGPLLLAGDDEALHFVSFPDGDRPVSPAPSWREDAAPFAAVVRQLDAYFAGTLTAFQLPLTFHGTPFQKRVWETLLTIPYGETRSYGWMAQAIGKPTASRAVGAANGANPIPIIVPCHRVIGADGSLTGFGGGIATKQFLLNLETPRLL